jgi:homoserine kinase
MRMPNKRDIKLDEYNISKYAYRELSNFCLQYPEKKQKLLDMRNPLKAQQYSDMPHGSGVGDPTAAAAIRAAALAKDTELIEQTAIEADAGIYQYIILAVTQQGVNYEILRVCKDIPCGREYFYLRRRLFFYLLAKKRGMT